MDTQGLLRDLGERLGGSASVRNVYGDPVTAGDRTVVPVARVFYSFGGGGGSRNDDQHGSGGGGGGVVAAWPAGALEVTSSSSRFIGVHDDKLIGLALATGFVLGMALAVVSRIGKR